MDAPTTPTARPPDRPPAHRVALYDMDRTITRAGTYSGFLIHVARRRQPWRLLLLPLVGLAGLAYALRLIDRAWLKAINLRLLVGKRFRRAEIAPPAESRSEEHTSELQSLMRTSYAVFCLKNTNTHCRKPLHTPAHPTKHR